MDYEPYCRATIMKGGDGEEESHNGEPKIKIRFHITTHTEDEDDDGEGDDPICVVLKEETVWVRGDRLGDVNGESCRSVVAGLVASVGVSYEPDVAVDEIVNCMRRERDRVRRGIEVHLDVPYIDDRDSDRERRIEAVMEGRVRVEEEGWRCSVCLSGISVGTECVETPGCKHVYHESCLLNWLRRSTTCPLCRFDFINDHQD